ncbi:hypothetical protein [Persephonella sp.]
MRKAITTILLISTGIVAGYVATATTMSYQQKEVYIEVDNSQKVIDEKIKKLQNEILDELSVGCETKGVKEPDATIILDTNNKMSIGRYQWQIASVQYYYKKIYGKDINRVEAIQIAIDKEKATELTRDVLFTEQEGYKNWWTCSQRLNLKDRINLINKL